MQRALPIQPRWSSLLLGRKERLMVGLSLGQSYLVTGRVPPSSSSSFPARTSFLCTEVEHPAARGPTRIAQQFLFPSPEGELVGPRQVGSKDSSSF